ncbi:unnamed protein product [Cyprideis torosa]|uniref:Uncharacterized protein n=1 Tax=Cyprideis torosa TaxID=163714 RepID=A0A7R8WHQ7_9CRUS|nr:unnamed protein product [Cyprideis torosa]CAG0893182.1 unnamed protein product [Cyprideis torosa]
MNGRFFEHLGYGIIHGTARPEKNLINVSSSKPMGKTKDHPLLACQTQVIREIENLSEKFEEKPSTYSVMAPIERRRRQKYSAPPGHQPATEEDQFHGRESRVPQFEREHYFLPASFRVGSRLKQQVEQLEGDNFCGEIRGGKVLKPPHNRRFVIVSSESSPWLPQFRDSTNLPLSTELECLWRRSALGASHGSPTTVETQRPLSSPGCLWSSLSLGDPFSIRSVFGVAGATGVSLEQRETRRPLFHGGRWRGMEQCSPRVLIPIVASVIAFLTHSNTLNAGFAYDDSTVVNIFLSNFQAAPTFSENTKKTWNSVRKAKQSPSSWHVMGDDAENLLLLLPVLATIMENVAKYAAE